MKAEHISALHHQAWLEAYRQLIGALEAIRDDRRAYYARLTQGLTPESEILFSDPRFVPILTTTHIIGLLESAIQGFKDGEAMRQRASLSRPPADC